MILRRWAFVLLAITGFLAGCSSDDSPEEAGEQSVDDTTTSTTEDDGPGPDDEDDGGEPASGNVGDACDPVVLEAGATVSGADLGTCMAAAMRAAGSGSQRVEHSDGDSSLVDFTWTPEFSMTVDGGAMRTYIQGDDGWVSLDGTGWIKADAGSDDPQVVMATGIVDVTRAAGHPEVMVGAFAPVDWTVVDLEEVPAADAVVSTAWHLVPSGPYTVAGVSLSDVHLYLTGDHLGAYFVGTGSVAGQTVTTSNTFLQWGGVVDVVPPDLDVSAG